MISGPLLLLASALFHACWNALAKSAKDKAAYLFITMLVGALLCLGLIITTGRTQFPDNAALFATIAAGIFEGLYVVSLAKTLNTTALGTSYAIMRGGAMILVWGFSLTFLGESATAFELSGAALVLLGIFIMNQERAVTGTARPRFNPWPYLSALFIAGYHLFYHQALQVDSDPLPLYTISVLVSLPFMLLGMGPQKIKRIRHTLRTETVSVLGTSILATLSFVIFLFGLRLSGAGFAISLRNTSIFFAIILSYILKESLSRAQLIGAGVIGVGAILLSL